MPLLLILLLVAPSAVLAAPRKPAPVKLVNPGFDDELKGWDNVDATAMTGAFSPDKEVQRNGKSALHVKPQSPDQWPWVSQRVAGLEPGAVYVLSVWHQGATRVDTGKADESNTCAAVKLEFLDEAGKSLGARVARQPLKMAMWQFLAAGGQAPPTTSQAVISLRVMGDQEAWFDDVELTRTEEAPRLALTPARLALNPGEAGSVHLQVTAVADLPEAAQATVELLGPNGKAVKGVTGQLARQDKRTFAGDLAVPALTAGTHTVRVKVGKEIASGSLFVSPAERRPTGLNERGVLLGGDGQPFFPIGMYHAALGDYKVLAEQGFNMVQGMGSHTARLQRLSVQEAQGRKLALQIPLYTGGMVGANLKSSQEKMAYFRKSTTVLDWKIADQPDQHPETADEVPVVYAALKEKEPQHPLALTVADPESYGYWGHFCDALQVVAMPLPDQPLTVVVDRVKTARQALAPWQHVSVVLPAGYRTGGVVQPTADQARMMVYLAVIGGARGVWWYALRSPGFRLADTELWKSFKRLNEETAALGAAVVGGTETALQSDNGRMQSAAWRTGDKVQIAVANPDSEAQTATLKFEGACEKAEIAKGIGQAEVKDGAVQVMLRPGQAVLIAVSTGK